MYKNNSKGFTLLELIIVIIIIGVLGIIAVPKFNILVKKSKEGAAKSALGVLRSAITVYSNQHQGTYPDDISKSPFVGTYIDKVPTIKLVGHQDSNKVKINGGIDGKGGWYYDSTNGKVSVNSNDTDTKGDSISSW
jgi:prepilin-type N-terminal cleavage/methylation domain-containing protein